MGYGQGSLTERRGKWIARYWGPDGKQRSKSFDRKTDARAFLATVHSDKARGNWIDPKGGAIGFADWAWEWFRSQHGLGATARQRDEGLLRNHVIPAFGKKPIGKISPLDTRQFVNDLVAKGLAPATVHLCYRLFASPMKAAAEAKMIAHVPIGRGIVVLPKIQRKPERFLTEHEVELLAAEIGPYAPLIYAAAYTGCRWQELAGLKRCYLDLPGARLHVVGVLERTRGTFRYKEHPKSDAGRRSIALPGFLVELLQTHLKAQPLGEWVFTADNGGILFNSNFRDRHFNPAWRAAGLKKLWFHDLRHTHAAWLIRDGVQPLALQRRLGHEDIRTTMTYYGHLFPNHEDDLIETLEQRRQEALEAPDSGSAKVFSLPT